uniref:CDPalcohol phosphatidyltransferase putative n=1 Tax=Albugo laibachii Nc14 TaxID=890382 RepID=F0WGR5_9STRA|nr:CDPalcohol phosphatidyltransferase putative [Albugo laibachii Nc14]|eukprot:CCA20429.1 CDPalcohol phosphatidyltransferase putative [Albugo laibachii Nc14]
MVLSKKALAGIATYRYKPGTYTILDTSLTPFWTRCVSFFPIWMAPNLITLLGSCTLFLTTAIQLVYSPHFSETPPRWIPFTAAAGLFIYQTLDALDGKQARRTGSSSPLGQLFDHGCDAICTLFTAISAAATVQFGGGFGTFFLLSSLCTTFYLAQWEEYHTGIMTCGNGVIGVTEGQFLLIGVHLIAAVFGSELYAQPIFQSQKLGSVTFATALLVALVASNVLLVLGNIAHVLQNAQQIPSDELGHKQVSKLLACIQLIPVALVTILSWLWISGPNEAQYREFPLLFLGPIGILYVLLSTRMIVSHMCKIPFSSQLLVLLPAILVTLSGYAAQWSGSEEWIHPMMATISFGAFMLAIYMHYVYHVVMEICNHLGIQAFKIKARKE